MKNYELYIDNRLIELDDKFDFALIFNSPVFQEISKVKSNRTSTIKVPKTALNLAAINFCNLPENITEFPYRTKPVRLFRNGLPVIKEGTGYIIAISDSIEFAITWGVSTVDVEKLKERKLRELPDDGNNYIIWDKLIDGNWLFYSNNNFGFALSDFGANDVDEIFHPFASFKWVFDKVQDESGINVEFPEKINELYEKLYIPILETNPNPLQGEEGPEFNFTGNFEVNVLYGSDPGGYISGNSIIIQEKCIISFSGSIDYTLNSPMPLRWVQLRIYKNNIFVYLRRFGSLENMILDDESTIECNQGDIITFRLEVKPIIFDAHWNPPGTSTGSFKLIINPPEVRPGEKYPIICNLPDITGFDMLNTIMAMFGLFGSYMKEGIKLFSIDEFYDKKNEAKNWTGKVITGSKIDSISFSFGDFARKNYLRYSEDETVLTDADWYLKVDNDALEEEKTLYEMKFAASDDSIKSYPDSGLPEENVVYIPLYKFTGEYDPDDGITPIFEKNKIENRIVLVNQEGQNLAVASFNELFFNSLINTYYSNYQKIILHPKMIEVTLLLTDLDIYTLDMMTPVYLEQTGNYYIISELQVNGNNVVKAKLLQM